jgi:hypothetical protein
LRSRVDGCRAPTAEHLPPWAGWTSRCILGCPTSICVYRWGVWTSAGIEIGFTSTTMPPPPCFLFLSPLKGPCLVLVIEWQPRWTNCVKCEIHRWLVHMYMCVSNICHGGENVLKMVQSLHMWWWRSSFHMRHDIESCDQGGED